MSLQYHVLRSHELTNAVLQLALQEGWTINPEGFILLARQEPEAPAPADPTPAAAAPDAPADPTPETVPA